MVKSLKHFKTIVHASSRTRSQLVLVLALVIITTVQLLYTIALSTNKALTVPFVRLHAVRKPPVCIHGAALPKNPDPPLVNLVDRFTRLKLMGTAKGGATLTAQLFFRHLGLLEEAYKLHPFIHFYREKWMREHKNERAPCGVCANSNWTCVFLIRSPLDRAVSSYHHTMRTSIKDSFTQLHTVVQLANKTLQEASFADFLGALSLRAAANVSTGIGNPHFMSQSRSNECEERLPSMFLVPLEAVVPALETIQQVKGIRLNATGLRSRHYIAKTPLTAKNPIHDAGHDPPPPDGTSLPYDTYLQNRTLTELLCRLYCHDLALYQSMCLEQQWIRSNPAVWHICSVELERIDSVCGATGSVNKKER